MTAYVPSASWVVALWAACVVVVFIAGYVLHTSRSTGTARIVAWSMLVVGTVGLERLTSAEPAGVRMLALITFALLGMKVIVAIEERARGMRPLSLGMWFGFAGAWIGMRPRHFAAAEHEARRGAGDLVRRGAIHAATGVTLVVLARMVWTGTQSPLFATVLLLPGLSLIVHFGLCNVLAGAWRWRGVACDALFRAPLRSESLGEFWARRWNVAFSEMTTIAIYRPLADRVGRGPAVMAGFALSGLLHEMAISVPVQSGFGLPLLYFLLHGGLVLVERALTRAGVGFSGWRGRAWVMWWVLVPLPILFHHAFLAGVIWPMIGIVPKS